jgi:mycofactocin precursor
MPEPLVQLPAMDAEMPTNDRQVAEEDALTSEMLVEEISIDGMCGVY